MLLQILIQTLIPAFFITVLLHARYTSKFKWFTESLVYFLAILFIFVTARWDLTSYYLRVLVFPIFLIACHSAYRKITPDGINSTISMHLWANILNFALIIVFGWLNISILSGFFYPNETVRLNYPLRNGVYYVGGGGSNRWINNHNAAPPQDYALDIVRLNFLGVPINFNADKSHLEQYAIFGDPIYSPCDGTVVKAVDKHVDQIPPNRDSANLAGNHVLIACQDVEILLAHMKQGSVLVAEGDTVNAGDEIGAVGNSGNTSQPHLHIHTEKDGAEGEILDGKGVPMIFEGRFLERNDLFTGR